MTCSRVYESLVKLAIRATKSSRFVALAIIAAFTTVAMQPAHAQSSDTWKSVAIIGGSTAAGAYIGHKMGGGTGALVGAGVGAGIGYEVDSRRRAGNYYNQASNGGGYYPTDGYYGNGGYGNGGPNGGYNDGGAYPYPAGYQSNNYSNSSRYYNRH